MLTREFQLNHDTGTLIGISDMLARGENLLKPEINAGFAADKPILVLHGSGDKACLVLGLTFMYIPNLSIILGHQLSLLQTFRRLLKSQR